MNWKADTRQGEDAIGSVVEWGAREKVIVVPLDGSIESKVVLRVAKLISKTTGAALQVLYVTERPLPREELLRQLKLSRREETVGVIIEQTVGAPAEQIVRTAVEKQAMLIAMTTRGQTAYQGRVLRPVPEQVAQMAPCPVLLVRPEIAPRVAQLGALRRLLMPLDGMPSTMAATRPAVSLAERSGAEIDVLCVAALRQRGAEELGSFTVPRYIDHPQHEWPAWAQETLDRLCVFLQECPIVVPARVFVRHGEPAAEILQFAAERGSDVIVLEWHGRFNRTRAPVVRRVLEKAPCPVLLLRTYG